MSREAAGGRPADGGSTGRGSRKRHRSLELIQASRDLAAAVGALRFGDPVRHVYNPLEYARRPHEAYLSRYGDSRKRVVFVGMNPGPWGMAQTGVPFGEVGVVREWLGIQEPVDRPPDEHPGRPVLGFAITRSEASCLRLWGLMRRRFCSPGAFFAGHFVANYCPLLFLDAGGRNLTPDRLRSADRVQLYGLCDGHLRRVAEILEPEWLVGIGRFTEERLRRSFEPGAEGAQEAGGTHGGTAGATAPRVAGILHPSPASPKANRGWAEAAEARLRELGIW